MIRASQIVNRKQRFILSLAVNFLSVRSDTFVFICRDMGFRAGEISYLLAYYYKMRPMEAKSTAFTSNAWPASNKTVEVSNAFFDYFEDQSKQE